MGEQLQNLGLVPTLCAFKPHGSNFLFYFCKLLGSPALLFLTAGNVRKTEEMVHVQRRLSRITQLTS